MDALPLTSPVAGRRRRGLVESLRRRARLYRRARAVAAAAPVELLRVDESIKLDPTLLDRDGWLAWGRANLTAEQFERCQRAVEADRREAQREAVC